MEYKSDGDTNCNWCARYCHQMIGKETGGLGNKNTSGDHLNESIIKIGQNTKRSRFYVFLSNASNFQTDPFDSFWGP